MSDQLLDGPDKAVDEEDSDETSEPEMTDNKPSTSVSASGTSGYYFPSNSPLLNQSPLVNNYVTSEVQLDSINHSDLGAHGEEPEELAEPPTDYSLQYQESEEAEVNESNQTFLGKFISHSLEILRFFYHSDFM